MLLPGRHDAAPFLNPGLVWFDQKPLRADTAVGQLQRERWQVCDYPGDDNCFPGGRCGNETEPWMISSKSP